MEKPASGTPQNLCYFLLNGFRFFKANVEDNGNNEADDADQLRDRQTGKGMGHPAEDITPVIVTSEEFDKKTDNGVVQDVERKYLPMKFLLAIEEEEEEKVQEI